MTSQQLVSDAVSGTGPNQDANVESSSASKIAFDTLFPSTEVRPVSDPESSEDSGFFGEQEDVIPHGTDYQDFILFPQSPTLSPVISDIDSSRSKFFADADAVTTADAPSPSPANHNPTTFVQRDITYRPARNLSLSTNPYDAMDCDTFTAIDAASYEAITTDDDSSSFQAVPPLHYSTTSYGNTMVSSPIENWASTYDRYESFASHLHLGRTPYDFVGGAQQQQQVLLDDGEVVVEV